MQLIPCPQCRRHVKPDEAMCPFCNADVSTVPRPQKRAPARRTSRAAYVLAATAGAVSSTTGCTESTDEMEEPAESLPVYGAPVADGGAATDSGDGANEPPAQPPGDEMGDPPEIQPVYGIPVPDDAGMQNTDDDSDAGDEGDDEGGEGIPVYGAAPGEDS